MKDIEVTLGTFLRSRSPISKLFSLDKDQASHRVRVSVGICSTSVMAKLTDVSKEYDKAREEIINEVCNVDDGVIPTTAEKSKTKEVEERLETLEDLPVAFKFNPVSTDDLMKSGLSPIDFGFLMDCQMVSFDSGDKEKPKKRKNQAKSKKKS